MPDSRIYDYVMFLHSVATLVRPDPMLIAPIRDPNDMVVLQTAIIGGAEAICTTDEDFFNIPASFSVIDEYSGIHRGGTDAKTSRLTNSRPSWGRNPLR